MSVIEPTHFKNEPYFSVYIDTDREDIFELDFGTFFASVTKIYIFRYTCDNWNTYKDVKVDFGNRCSDKRMPTYFLKYNKKDTKTIEFCFIDPLDEGGNINYYQNNYRYDLLAQN